MGWHKPDNVAGSSAPAIMVGFFVATGGLLFGYDTGYASGIPPIDRHWVGTGKAHGREDEERWKSEEEGETWDEHGLTFVSLVAGLSTEL